MEPDNVLRISREAMMLVLLVSAAPVLAALGIGLIVSLLQAATQLQEQTLTAVPKIVAVFAALLIAGPWILHQLVQFATLLFQAIH